MLRSVLQMEKPFHTPDTLSPPFVHACLVWSVDALVDARKVSQACRVIEICVGASQAYILAPLRSKESPISVGRLMCVVCLQVSRSE